MSFNLPNGKIDTRKKITDSYFPNDKFVKELSPNNFLKGNLKDKRCGAVLFYKPSCGWCKKLRGTWSELGKVAIFCNVYAFNCELYSEFCSQKKGGIVISSYPSIILYRDGKVVKNYRGERDLVSLLGLVMQETPV